ncbi:MAG: response regulator [Ferruginibacter sp.]|nr:response regulator [Ferruginibacter sp.]
MLIDDDKLTNFVNKMVIDEAGCAHHVVRKESVQSGLEYLSNSALSHGVLQFPDLIFLDMDMPVQDGWKFVDNYKKLKGNLPFSPVIIMLSSFNEPAYVAKASNLPELSGFYNKPMSNQILKEVIPLFFNSGDKS